MSPDPNAEIERPSEISIIVALNENSAFIRLRDESLDPILELPFQPRATAEAEVRELADPICFQRAGIKHSRRLDLRHSVLR